MVASTDFSDKASDGETLEDIPHLKKMQKGRNKIVKLKLVTSFVACGAAWWQRAVASLRQSVSLSDGETLGLDSSSNTFKSFHPDYLLLIRLRYLLKRKNFSANVMPLQLLLH